MNLTKKTILALGLLAAVGAGYAQTEAQTTSLPPLPVGLLGQSYSEVHAGLSDLKGYSKHQYGVGVAANLPVTPYLDVGAGYDYGWIRKVGHFNGVAATATAYTSFNGVKPFIGAGVGYQWTSASGYNDNFGVWGLSAGVEIPAGAFTLTPRIVYADDFRNTRESGQSFTYEVEGNYWLTRTAAVFASVGYSDVRRSSDESWDYTVGARFKF